MLLHGGLLRKFLVYWGEMKKENLLLSTCCAPCATVALERLEEEYNVTPYFWGSNIHPHEEYKKRLDAVLALSPNAIIAEYQPIQPATCEDCFETRLRISAEYARRNGFPIFATTLTTSPHKPVDRINQIGMAVAAEYNLEYLPTDFKKKNGFSRSVEISKSLGLYRQNFCGCERSRKQKFE